MKSIISIIGVEVLEGLASRSNFRYGKEAAKDGNIIFVKTNTYNLIAEVKYKDGEKRTVTLSSTPKGLRWKCTCTSRKDLFCKHCVAVGLAATIPKYDAG